ncbi:MAG TPA: metalloregulator ArsR/SmtB family transcription factor [Polyangiaceae bacterium]|nr:metalloregulator ArsR/SmtB family transcription factor [Polyangiaceae bacterium]
MVETFAALGQRNRFRIVEFLAAGPRTVNEIGEKLSLNQPQVSKHLGALKKAGLVQVEPRAQQRIYALRPEPLREMSAWLEKYRDLLEARFESLDELLEELESKKERSNGRRKRR